MLGVLKNSIPRPFIFLGIVEFALLIVCFYLGTLWSWVDVEFGFALLQQFWLQAFIFAAVFIVAMFAMGLYEGLLNSSVASVLVRLAAAFLAGFVVLSSLFYALPEFSTWRAVTAISWGLAVSVIALVHVVFLNFTNLSALKRRTLVVGVEQSARQIEDLEKRGQAYGFTCVGFVQVPGETVAVSFSKIVQNSQSLNELAKGMRVAEIVLALEDGVTPPMDELVECSFRGMPIIDYVTFWERETKRIDLNALQENWIVLAGGLPGGLFHHFVMRTFDIVFSLFMLVVLLPVVVGTAVAIKLDSPGPVFYRQSRVGLRGKPFDIIKFRSMRVDAEADGVPQWSNQSDPRVTGVGAFIRKTRIDEIPQIFNVLRGDMKFVGPRPERPYFVEQLAEEIPFYMQRFQVKPGITGWAQVHYAYAASAEDTRAKLEYDLYYIKHYSLLLDIIIILQTIRVIFWPHRMPVVSPEAATGHKTSLPLEEA
jgi:sugar transferase (PEP-CTERM system associated)